MTHPAQRRGRGRVAAILAVGLAAAAAVGAGASALAASGSAPATAPPTAAVSDEVLTVGTRAEQETLDPHVHGSRDAYMIDMHIFDTLVTRDPETNEFADGLASSWEVLDDGQRYVFTLKPDVTFHDGTPFDAAAVVFNLERIVDPATNSAVAVDILGPFASAEVIDDLTVAVNYSTETSSTAVLDAFSQAYLSMVSPAAVEKYGEDFGRNPVGTGPFVFTEWVTNDHIRLDRNDDYAWGSSLYDRQGPPWAAGIVFRPVPEPATRVAALESGDLDLAAQLDPTDAARIEGGGGFSLARGVAPGFPVSFWMNTEAGPTADLAVRQAVLYAFDRDTMLDAIYLGQFAPAFGPLSPATYAVNEDLESMYPYDPEKAAAILDEAGWALNDDGIREKDGQTLTLRLFDLRDQRRGEYLQANLEAVGIEVVPRIVESSDLFALTRDATQYEMASTWFASSDPSILSTLFLSSNIADGFAISRFADPALDEMLDDAFAMVDDDARSELYREIQQYIMDNALILPLYSETEIVGYADRLSGVRLELGQMLDLYDVTG